MADLRTDWLRITDAMLKSFPFVRPCDGCGALVDVSCELGLEPVVCTVCVALPWAREAPCSLCRVLTRVDLLEDVRKVEPMLGACCPCCVERVEDGFEASAESAGRCV